MTVAEILGVALPQATEADLAHCRVALATPAGLTIVPPCHWARLKPRPGVRVVIRLTPRKNTLRSVLSIVVAIAAIAAGAYFGPGLAAAIGLGTSASAVAAGTALVSLGVNLVGNMLINALVPPVRSSGDRGRNSYAISGFRNRLDPDGAVPFVLGTIRVAPPFAATTFTEIVGDEQYVHGFFLVGDGEVQFTDIRIGETDIGNFTDVATEVRYGVDGEDPCSLYPQQVVEENVGVELVRPLPRDSLGDVIDGPAEETPVVRTCGPDASGASVILAWPGGLVRFNDEGDRRERTVSIRIEQRLIEGEEWQDVTTLEITAKKVEGFYRQHSWTFPSRGRWQVRLTRMTDENTNDRVQDRTSWAALQTLRPEYPINYPKPLALMAMRIKATHQLNGALDNVSVLASRVCLDWDQVSETWLERATSNPASIFRLVLQHPANPKPVDDSGIDLEQLADWHDFCADNELTYCRVLEDADVALRDILTEIAAAGRAGPRHDGVRWGVVIDRPSDLIVDHIHPRNSWNFSMTRTYVDPPDGFVVKFKDASNDFKDTQRIVPWPGFTGDPELLETLEQPGNTDPDSIYREGYRRALEVTHRPDVYEVTQDGAVRVATRGDTVRVTYDVLDAVQVSGRVVQSMDALIELDELVTMEAGKTYGIRFRTFAATAQGETPDTIGTSVVRTVKTQPGETHLLMLEGNGDIPAEDDWVVFGEAGLESFAALVTSVEATEDMCSLIRMVDAAPDIDDTLATIEIPTWSGRIGDEIDANLAQPSAPRFTSVSATYDGEIGTVTPTGVELPVEFLIEPGNGTVLTSSYVIEYQADGDSVWTAMGIPAANGGGKTADFPFGTLVHIRAYAVSAQAVAGPSTPTISIEVGGAPADIPDPLDEDAIVIAALLGGATIQFATGTDTGTGQVQLYRSTTSSLDRETDAVGAPLPTAPVGTYGFEIGDTTRQTLIAGGDMSDAGDWSADASWSVASGVAAHSPGTAAAIGQPLSAVSGKWYRIAFSVTGRTAGSVTPRLTGGSIRPGAAVSADGDHSDRIQAVTGNDTIEFLASSDFDGAIDDIVVYLETAACLDQGSHFVWLEPQSEAGLPGDTSGPFEIIIQ
ncbi:MAG: phage tail protein [Rhodobacteraceae bacterium]|nr:phage tail protein [Paracoccaceae bacterium]